MKRIAYLCIILVFLITSCAVKTTIDPETQQKVKIFENKDFILHYPEHWDVLYQKFLESGVIVGFADKKDIHYSKKEKVKPYSYTYVAVYKDKMPFDKFDSYIQKKEAKMAENSTYETVNYHLNKLTDNHYLISYDTNPKLDNKWLRQNFHIHYLYEKGNVYEIEFISKPERFEPLLTDFTLILESFKVK